MKNPTRKEAAVLSRAEAVANGEQTRWAAWEAVSLVDRQRAVGVAGLPKERASDPLAAFTDDERARIRVALYNHVARMEFIMQCMNASNTSAQGWLH